MQKDKEKNIMLTVEHMLAAAREKGASDILLTAGVPPMVRVNGSLEKLDYPELTPEELDRIVFSVMNEQQLKIYREKGETGFALSVLRNERYRVNVFRQQGCAACSIRIVHEKLPTAEQLCIPEAVTDLAYKKRGLVIMAGTSGSGKTTTLAAVTDKINKERNAHIITIEDPIEYVHCHEKAVVNQREIGTDAMSCAGALRAALREDADVIVVGEIKDLDTVSAAVTAAETGHLVLSTFGAAGAQSVIERIIAAYPTDSRQNMRLRLSMVLEAVISQQLIPREDKAGRVAAFEIMYASDPIKQLIKEGNTGRILSVMRECEKEGMITMDDALTDLCLKGVISAKSAVEYAWDSCYVKAHL